MKAPILYMYPICFSSENNDGNNLFFSFLIILIDLFLFIICISPYMI